MEQTIMNKQKTEAKESLERYIRNMHSNFLNEIDTFHADKVITDEDLDRLSVFAKIGLDKQLDNLNVLQLSIVKDCNADFNVSLTRVKTSIMETLEILSDDIRQLPLNLDLIDDKEFFKAVKTYFNLILADIETLRVKT